jgi:hypothetical protein
MAYQLFEAGQKKKILPTRTKYKKVSVGFLTGTKNNL